jgi:hypothetical protein
VSAGTEKAGEERSEDGEKETGFSDSFHGSKVAQGPGGDKRKLDIR